MVQQPGDPQAQQAVSDSLSRLQQELPSASSNSFPATWRQTLEELGLEDVLGDGLLTTVTGVMQRNDMTPAIAAEELAPVAKKMEDTEQTLLNLVDSLTELNVGAEELEAGDVEVAVLIPRRAVSNDLAALGAEFVELRKILMPFVELATGSRPDLEVRALASSDFGVFLHSAPAVGAGIAIGVERVVAVYKQVLEIRSLRQSLKDQGMSEDTLAHVDAEAEARVAKGVTEVIEELTSQRAETGRIQELRLELRRSLNAIANRIDSGYNFDVRTGPDEEPVEDADPDSSAVSAQDISHLAQIRSLAPELKFLSPAGAPILSLPERDEAEGEGEGTSGGDG